MADSQIEIVVAEEKHRGDIIRLMKDEFLSRSPVWAALKVTWDEAAVVFEASVNKCLVKPVSFVAIDTSTPDQRVIGCRLSVINDLTKGGDDDEDFFKRRNTKNLAAIAEIQNRLMRGWKRELKAEGIKIVLEFVILCVEEAYGGRGVSQKLMDRSMKLAEELGVDYVFALASNWRIQRVFEKLNFETRRTLEFASVLDPETGKPYATPTDGSKCTKWVGKKMKP